MISSLSSPAPASIHLESLANGGNTAAGLHHEWVSASFGKRAMALIIDCVLLLSLYLSSIMVISYCVLESYPADPQLLLASSFVLLALGVLLPPVGTLIYFTFLHANGGQTVGKLFMGIRVVAKEGTAISLGAAFLRWVGYMVSFLPMLAGFFWVLIDKNHAAWHDKLAGSMVISV